MPLSHRQGIKQNPRLQVQVAALFGRARILQHGDRYVQSQVLLTIMLMWGICGLLTVTDYLPLGHAARTDVKIGILEESPWFRFPYPGQWGVPTVSASGVLGMLAGVLACTVESISYYPTTARMCGTLVYLTYTECSDLCGE
uniref:Uncharacterized protein n=1 Tax=Timema tahoe TaxID=61484 RepID=A0A7R9P1S3_9NEOP|nr:unnamed protein product [Timema tahoe]